MRELRRIIVHHSATPRSTTVASIEQTHRVKGYSYHYIVPENGIPRSVRALDVVGVHAGGANTGAIGICGVGNNTLPDEAWTLSQWDAIAKLCRALRVVFGPLEVVRHGKVGTTKTLCPGLSDAQWEAFEATVGAA